MKKTIRIGTVESGDVFAKIEINDAGRLSISGVIGPKRNGYCHGDAGQIIMSFREYDHRGYMGLDDISPAAGWDSEKVRQFFNVWDRWHLNDMRAGSAAQEEWLRANPVNAVYPESYYEKASAALAAAGLNPDADGYKYGHAWKREDVPADVIEFLLNLPDADKNPAWV